MSKRPRPSSAPPAAAAPKPRHDGGPDKVSLALAGLGLLVTGYLGLLALLGGAPLLCTEGSSCELIQHSDWSRFLGIPVALWGFATYALIALFAAMPSTRLRRWRRLWTLSAIGLAISLYLTLAGILSLQAVCGWCLSSLVLLASLFAHLQLRRPPSAPGTPWRGWLINHGAFLFCLLAFMHVYYSGLLAPRADARTMALAQHLQTVGAKFYGASWCPNCQQQKKLFAGAAEQLPYVECSPNGRQGGVAFACTEAGVAAYPTWIIQGRRYEQLLSPEELALRSGFDWNGFKPPQ